MKRRVAIVLTTRGNYAKMKSTMQAIRSRGDLELVLIVGGGIIQGRFGDFRPKIIGDGFSINAELDFLVDGGETLGAMTASAAAAVRTMGEVFEREAVDVVVIIADRYESLSLALAATCMNVPIAHLEGGEISGSIDERLRHAITKLSHVHFPATKQAAEILGRLGEWRDRIHVVGTPSLDIIRSIDLTDTASIWEGQRAPPFDLLEPYVVVSQHPVVTEYASARSQIQETAAAVAQIGLPAIWIRPNMDAGGDGIRSAIDDMERTAGDRIAFYPSFPIEKYAVLLHNAACLIGNTSSGLREGEFLGVPVVNIGTRQMGRERGANVLDVEPDRDQIVAAARRQIAHGRYESAHIYGDGRSGEKIAEALARANLDLDKRLSYPT